MSGIMMMVIAIVVLGGVYSSMAVNYEKRGIDPNAKTPAYEMEDGVDYVPADTNIVFGHQFASIRRCGSDQRTDPGCNLRMAAGTVMDPDRWCILRSSTGFLCNVCFCKK